MREPRAGLRRVGKMPGFPLLVNGVMMALGQYGTSGP